MVQKSQNTPPATNDSSARISSLFLIPHIHSSIPSHKASNPLFFLLVLPACVRAASSLLVCACDINAGMPPSLALDHLLCSTDHADFSARRQLSDVSIAVAKARRIVTVSGAGISCSSGIPVSWLALLLLVRGGAGREESHRWSAALLTISLVWLNTGFPF